MTSRHFTRSDIDNMEQRFRANFINCLSGYKSANLVGTVSKEGMENLAIISSVVHLGANPPLLGMIIRPHTVRRDTLENLKETGVYTINHVDASASQRAHQTSARYHKQESEFDATGLNGEYLDDFPCPYVASSPIRLGMELVEIIPISHNDTLFVIGEVQHVYLPETLLQEDGFVPLDKAHIICINGLDSYLTPSDAVRYAYAKRESEAQEIKP